MKKSIYQLGLWSLILALAFACEEDTVEAEKPTASFQYEVGETDFLTVTFENFSQNYESSEWNFGDDSEVSAEVNPVHTYEAAGTYDVTLTVTSASGETAERTESVEVEDPNAKLTLLTGTESKTWSLVREGVSMYHTAGWAGLQNDGARPCYYDDTFTFFRDGSYEFNDAGTFWAEYGIWNNAGCDANTVGESCFEATAANMVNECGDDVSAWMSGTYEYTYDAANNQITLTGDGAWMGLPGLGTSAQTITPNSEVTFNANVIDGGETGVDTLKVQFDYEGISYPITYVSYDDPGLAPEIVQEAAPFGEDLENIAPETMGHTFATAESFDLLGSIAGATIITVGADDPTDATASKVGEVTRVGAEQYQEAQLRVSPDPKDITFDNISTVSVDVYFPSENDYENGLTKVFTLGFADQSQTEQWWTALTQYVSAEIPLDTWTTVTFDLTTAAQTGALVSEREDLDMIFLSFGGGGHNTEATFYVRDLSFE